MRRVAIVIRSHVSGNVIRQSAMSCARSSTDRPPSASTPASACIRRAPTTSSRVPEVDAVQLAFTNGIAGPCDQ